MNTSVFVANKLISLFPAKIIGKGGEADVYDIGNGEALKVFKPADHPDYEGLTIEQQGAIERIETHQTKLRQFPKNLPNRVITPIELAWDYNHQKIVGYTMKFLYGTEVLKRYSEQLFRQSTDANSVVEIFRDLHPTVVALHTAKVVIGDFNDLNVLVYGNKAYLVDADSMQFGRFFCKVFTTKFVDPLLCDPNQSGLQLIKPHSPNSDWYAYTTMLMQSLIFVDPYGGVYKPKDKSKKIPHGQRPLHRITIFDSEVQYPKPAIPYGMLPDDLLEYFLQMYKKDNRGPFPLALLSNLRWTKCKNCGTEHARKICPNCTKPNEQAIKQTITVRGNVTANRFFRTSGQIVFATYQEGQLLWLYHQDQKLMRENGSIVSEIELNPTLRFRIQENKTFIGKGNKLLTVSTTDQKITQNMVDSYGTLPVFDANQSNLFWLQNGQLLKDDKWGPDYIGDVLKDQTLFWVGPTFGFGFYMAQGLNIAFVFDANKKGINDSVKLPRLRGQLVDSTCFFSKDFAWFFLALKFGSKIINHCIVIKSNGNVEAYLTAEEGDNSWLGTLRGKCAAGNFLLAATDDGIVRLEIENNQIVLTRTFPDTEPFVSSGSHLFPAPDGIYVISKREITLLKIK